MYRQLVFVRQSCMARMSVSIKNLGRTVQRVFVYAPDYPPNWKMERRKEGIKYKKMVEVR
jgi:hypothetical protein